VKHPVTPDGRYFVVRGRLWRMANPRLDGVSEPIVGRLMDARRAVRDAKKAADREAEAKAHRAVDEGQAGAQRAQSGVVGRRITSRGDERSAC
jgi:hypothetical protein